MHSSILLYLGVVLLFASCQPVQEPYAYEIEGRIARYLGEEKPKPQIAILGVFHMNYPGLDSHKTDEDLRVDVLENDRQQQLEELKLRLSAFSPTIVAVESRSQIVVDSLFTLYKQSKIDRNRNEIVQIGFRLARHLNIGRVHAVDVGGIRIPISDDLYEQFAEQYAGSEQRWNNTYAKYHQYSDTLLHRLSLIDYLRLENDPEMNKRGHGQYLLSTRVGNHEHQVGADGFITRWYNRNIRIFSNVQRLDPKPDDRILLIFGAGHNYILNNLFEASPDFDLVPINDIL